MFYSFRTSQFGLSLFQMLSGHICLMPAGLNSAALDERYNAGILSVENHTNLLSAIMTEELIKEGFNVKVFFCLFIFLLNKDTGGRWLFRELKMSSGSRSVQRFVIGKK